MERDALFEDDSDEEEGEESMSPQKEVNNNEFKFHGEVDQDDAHLHAENFDDRKKSA